LKKESETMPRAKKRSKLAQGPDNLEAVFAIARSMELLNQQAVREYRPIVEGIVRSRSRDVPFIEHTLDGLLDFCGFDSALVLYKTLCRHYWTIDPEATAGYVNAYREMWDADDLSDKA
jgi:hypothetical protein